MVEDPLVDCSTNRKEHIDKVMMQIEQTLRYAKGAKHVIVAGDQQTFKAMLTLKKDPVNTEYSWFTPVPGDWHALVHWLMAIDRSWYPGYPA